MPKVSRNFAGFQPGQAGRKVRRHADVKNMACLQQGAFHGPMKLPRLRPERASEVAPLSASCRSTMEETDRFPMNALALWLTAGDERHARFAMICTSCGTEFAFPKYARCSPTVNTRLIVDRLQCTVCRFLLLQDADTGDVVMPLLDLKRFFGSNYSRKLSGLKHRLVYAPEEHPLVVDRHPDDPLYWIWAFESPQSVRALVRAKLGSDAPQV